MNKIKIIVTMLAVVLALSFIGATATAQEDEDVFDNITLTRFEKELTDEGIVLTQTEKGIPDNHAVAIFEIPYDAEEMTVKLSIDGLSDYVGAGSNANDAWFAVNFMGVPQFFNWRNSEQHGYAKDTPGIVNRFLSYDGDLRIVTDVYHEDYQTALDETGITVDTWSVLQKPADAVKTDILTFTLKYDTEGEDSFYNLYLNGNLLSSAGEISLAQREVLFPEDKIYITIVSNTEDKEQNPYQTVKIHSINDTVYGEPDEDQDQEPEKPAGCKAGVFAMCSVMISAGLLAVYKLTANKENNV